MWVEMAISYPSEVATALSDDEDYYVMQDINGQQQKVSKVSVSAEGVMVYDAALQEPQVRADVTAADVPPPETKPA